MSDTTFYDIKLIGVDESKYRTDVYDNTYSLVCFKLSKTPDKFWLDHFDLYLEFEGELKYGRKLWIEQKLLCAGKYKIKKDKVYDWLNDFNLLFDKVNAIATEAKLEDRFSS
ncbi:hypothetical protein [Pseudescherichia vulneris]|uniref:hypothetical protein n=1 Tax=Pseudescherichia vulneris TaxID=566 RepID=UPI0028B035B4|nr:hypothetical protein [Pseudescherichia vulneris]